MRVLLMITRIIVSTSFHDKYMNGSNPYIGCVNPHLSILGCGSCATVDVASGALAIDRRLSVWIRNLWLQSALLIWVVAIKKIKMFFFMKFAYWMSSERFIERPPRNSI